MSNDLDPILRRTRFSRRGMLGGIGGGLVVAALSTPDAAEAALLPLPPRRNETASPVARRGCTVTPLQSGLVLVAGGLHASPTGATQIYDADRREWFAAAPMQTPRAHHAAVALLDGRVLVTGGRFLQVLSSAEIYDPRRDEWTQVAPMNSPRAEHGAALIRLSSVLVTGGFYRAPLANAEMYDAFADRWRRL